ncbi:hypothetical protein EB061_12520 [bacterium]|nr:hypothetical protein [bacterium]
MKTLLSLLVAFVSTVVFAQESPNTSLLGTYEISIRLGERDFKDILTITKVGNFFGPVEGTLEVPGVFSVPLENGRRHFCWCDLYDRMMSFSIQPTENGQTFRVDYSVTFDGVGGDPILAGQGEANFENGPQNVPFTIRRLTP